MESGDIKHLGLSFEIFLGGFTCVMSQNIETCFFRLHLL